MSHTMKLFERIINHMLRTIVELGNIHFVFRRGLSTMDPKRNIIHECCIFQDEVQNASELEEEFVRELWHCTATTQTPARWSEIGLLWA